MKEAIQEAIGWSAKCPYCEDIVEVSIDTEPANNVICSNCTKEFVCVTRRYV